MAFAAAMVQALWAWFSQVFAVLFGGRHQDDDEEYERQPEDVCIECSNDLNEEGNQHFWHSYPKGFGKRAKRASMRKALKCYKRAYSMVRKIRKNGANDMVEFRFRILANIASSYRALCDYDMLLATIRRLEDVVLYDVNDDATLDEYELRILSIEANALVSMYHKNYDMSRIDSAGHLFKVIEDAQAFPSMSEAFRSTHYHYVGLMNLICGEAHGAKAALTQSIELRKQAMQKEDVDSGIPSKGALKWSQKLLNKAEKRVAQADSMLGSVGIIATHEIAEEDIDDAQPDGSIDDTI